MNDTAAPRLPVKKRQVAATTTTTTQRQLQSPPPNKNKTNESSARSAIKVEMTTTVVSIHDDANSGSIGNYHVAASSPLARSYPKTKSFTVVRDDTTAASTKPTTAVRKGSSANDNHSSAHLGQPTRSDPSRPNQNPSWLHIPDELPTLVQSNGNIVDSSHMSKDDDNDDAIFSQATWSVAQEQGVVRKAGWPDNYSSPHHHHHGSVPDSVPSSLAGGLEIHSNHPAQQRPSHGDGAVKPFRLASLTSSSSHQPKQLVMSVGCLPPASPMARSTLPIKLDPTPPTTTAVEMNSSGCNDKKQSAEAADGKRFRRWTPKEDKLLKLAVEKEEGPPHNWKKISTDYFNDTRRPLQCKTRWKNALSPDINREPFSAEEDQLIIEHHKKGYRWPDMVPLLKGRTSEQIRERFVNNIDPSLKTTPWTDEEDHILTVEQRRLGNKWMEIKKLLPGRSEKSIKNRWHNRKTKQRRALRRMAAAKQFRADMAQSSMPSPTAAAPPPHAGFAEMMNTNNSTMPSPMTHLLFGGSVSGTMPPALSNNPPDLISEGMSGLQVQPPQPSNHNLKDSEVKRRVEL